MIIEDARSIKRLVGVGVATAVLETASAIVIVTNVSLDSARQAESALDWLRHNGYQDLLSRVVVVINHVAVGEIQHELVDGRVVQIRQHCFVAAGEQTGEAIAPESSASRIGADLSADARTPTAEFLS